MPNGFVTSQEILYVKVHSSLICLKANKHSFSIRRCPVKDKSSFWRRRWFLWIWVKSTMSIRNALCPYVKLWRIIHQNTLHWSSLFLSFGSYIWVHNINLGPKSICLYSCNYILSIFCEDRRLFDPSTLECKNILMCKDIKIIIFISFIVHHTSRFIEKRIVIKHSNSRLFMKLIVSRKCDEWICKICIHFYITAYTVNIYLRNATENWCIL